MACNLPCTLISSCACIILLCETSSSSHFYISILQHCASAQDPWALKGPRGLVKRPQMLKSIMMACMRDPLSHENLWHMNFPGDPAAFHGCRLIIPCGKQDAGPNELTNPEISMKNHPNFTHSFALILPAIFPAQ